MIVRIVTWAPSAANDFEDTVRYLKQRSPERALKFADAIHKTIADLGQRNTGRPGRVDGVYEKSVPRHPHVIAFAYASGAEELQILRIIHTARDWPEGGWPKD